MRDGRGFRGAAVGVDLLEGLGDAAAVGDEAGEPEILLGRSSPPRSGAVTSRRKTPRSARGFGGPPVILQRQVVQLGAGVGRRDLAENRDGIEAVGDALPDPVREPVDGQLAATAKPVRAEVGAHDMA